jgi:hypothetical protein
MTGNESRQLRDKNRDSYVEWGIQLDSIVIGDPIKEGVFEGVPFQIFEIANGSFAARAMGYTSGHLMRSTRLGIHHCCL